jgi:hypothetical protein
MAKTLEQERAALAEDERRLAERRRQLDEREREEAIKAVEKTGLFKIGARRIEALCRQIRDLGMDEVEKRLTGAPTPLVAAPAATRE